MPERENNSKKKETLFLIDYDLPKDSNKKQFYRELKKMNLIKSTESVILTTDLKTATKVRKKATAMGGKANFYKVKKRKA
jgi:hypothetical protein